MQRDRSERDGGSPWSGSRDELAWVRELVRVRTGLVRAHVPGLSGLPARTREQLIVTVAEVEDSRYVATVHGAWLDFLGDREPEEALAPLFAYARSCALAGRPLDTTTLAAVYPPAVVSSVRATVARAELATTAERAADRLYDRVVRRRSSSLPGVARDVAIVAASLPLAVPTVAVAGAMRLVDRLAPQLPEVRTPPVAERNLVVDLVAHALPSYLGNTVVRTGLLWAPWHVSIGFRMEGGAATLTIGKGEVQVHDGVLPDAWVVVDGGLDSVVELVAGSLARELADVAERRSS